MRRPWRGQDRYCGHQGSPGRLAHRPRQAAPGHIASSRSGARATGGPWSSGGSPVSGATGGWKQGSAWAPLSLRGCPALLLTCPTWSRMPPLAIIFRVCKAICWAREPSWVRRWLSQYENRKFRITVEAPRTMGKTTGAGSRGKGSQAGAGVFSKDESSAHSTQGPSQRSDDTADQKGQS